MLVLFAVPLTEAVARFASFANAFVQEVHCPLQAAGELDNTIASTGKASSSKAVIVKTENFVSLAIVCPQDWIWLKGFVV